jgi:DNA replication protein DnaC
LHPAERGVAPRSPLRIDAPSTLAYKPIRSNRYFAYSFFITSPPFITNLTCRQEQDEEARGLSFLDRLALLIDQQWNWRENQALTRRVKASRLRGAACVENIDYRSERGLNRSVIRALAQESCWVKNHEHIFVLGPTGVGKSYVASALAQKACRDGYSVHYTRVTGLFRDLNLARADGSLRQLLKRLNRIDVLVIDDWAMAPMAESERRDFWEIAEDRYQTRSMILTSQLPVSRWHEQIGNLRISRSFSRSSSLHYFLTSGAPPPL